MHFVNYNRTEPDKPKSPGKGISDEKPIPTPPIEVELVCPPGVTGAQAVLLTPEAEQPVALSSRRAAGRLYFTVPPFLVYGVVRVR